MIRKTCVPTSLLGAAVLGLAACGGGGHVAEISPAQMEQLNGRWVLDLDQSDDPLESQRRYMDRTEDLMAGEGRGRRGGRRGRGGAGGAQPPDSAVIQAFMDLARSRVGTMALAVTDSTVIATYPQQPAFELLFGEKVSRILAERVRLVVKAEWRDGQLVVTRGIDGWNSLVETFQPAQDGSLLTVEVMVEMGRGRAYGFRRVFARAEGD